MNCNVVKDLIPLYIDGCCSEESERLVKDHISDCQACKKLYEAMKAPSDTVAVSGAPKAFCKLNAWKASVLQSVLLFLSFALITVGVALEAKTPAGVGNGAWACNLIIPATGFMLSLANWYFVRLYQSRKGFSNVSILVTALITLCAYIWFIFHYEIMPLDMFTGSCNAGIGVLLTAAFCGLSKILSNQYAKLLGKE